MRYILLNLICVLVVNQGFATDYINFDSFKNAEVVSWSSDDGQKRFAKSKYKHDFVNLAQNYQPQINPLYCGIATSVILLNTFYDERPNQAKLATEFPSDVGNKRIEYKLYSQLSLLNDETDKIKDQEVIEFKKTNSAGEYDPGFSLKDLADLLGYYGLTAEVNYVEDKITDSAIDDFRNNLKSVLNDNTHYIVINFLGKSYGATTGGHISPVAAYDQKSDSVLLLDVASHKNPWYWVDLKLLYHAMHTKDGNNYRGYLLVSK